MLSLVFTFSVAAIPAVWPMYQFSPGHNAVFAVREPAYRWRYWAGEKINGGMAISANLLYVGTFGPAVVALDRRTGRLVWKAVMPNLVMTTPIVANGLVIVGTGRDEVALDTGARLVWARRSGDEIVALDAQTGARRWSYRTQGEDMPSAALVRVANRNEIVFANGDDRIRALDVRDGHLLWGTALEGVATMSSAAVEHGLVYVLAGLSAGAHVPDRVYAVRASDGAIVWRAAYGNADVSPTVADGLVFVEDAQTIRGPANRNAFNDVQALDAQTGRLHWSYESELGFLTNVGTNEEAVAGTVDGKILFASLPAARRFAAFDVFTGRVLWSASTHAAVKMSAVIAGGRVYVGDTSGSFYTLAESNGRILSQRDFDEPFTCSSPVIVGSTLYVADSDAVLALALRTSPKRVSFRGPPTLGRRRRSRVSEQTLT